MLDTTNYSRKNSPPQPGATISEINRVADKNLKLFSSIYLDESGLMSNIYLNRYRPITHQKLLWPEALQSVCGDGRVA